MKPTVISNVNTSPSTGSGNLPTGGHGITIPINQEYRSQMNNQHFQQPDFNTHAQHGEPPTASYGSPGSIGRGQREQQPHSRQQQESPLHYQDFDFDSNVGLDMFPRSRLGRMTHDPFGDFGNNSRKRSSLHDPHFHTDGFSRYFDDDADFGFPQFNSLGRRRINPHNDDDFFNRLPSEFRQYIPESFAHRRAGPGMPGSPGSGPTMVETQQPQSHLYNTMPQSPSRKVCDAAIQTEGPSGRSEVDHETSTESLNQNVLRNTMDLGLKSPLEKEIQSPRSSSAPPAESQQNIQQPNYTQSQPIPLNSSNRPATPPHQQNQSATQTSSHIQSGSYDSQSPQFHKTFYTPQRTHSQQKQQSPPPQTPGGSYIRTIPIFVEGRTDPIINNKEIPNQSTQTNLTSNADETRAFTSPKQQPRRPTPLNTQQKNTIPTEGLPPETPHTVDTINKIQNIQRDVLELMSRVEMFAGTRADKEYVYLDEMLTRNLLKLDNIETNGKDSIRLARKEAIKCIQASINVLEAKAEGNKKANKINRETSEQEVDEETIQKSTSQQQKQTSAENIAGESEQTSSVDLAIEPECSKNTPIPLPPPESEKFNEVKLEDCPEDDLQATCTSDEHIPKPDSISTDLSNSK